VAAIESLLHLLKRPPDIVWNALHELRLPSERFVFWNAFPWHPFDAKRGLLTNRKPSADELRLGAPILERTLQMFRCEMVIAMGAVADAQLEWIGRRATRVRHPANAGAALFREQLRNALL
jgi:uracil-DNA glycosylase